MTARADTVDQYKIAVGDVLQLDFLDDEGAPYPVPVGSDGAVQLPYLGALNILGDSLADAQAAIVRAYVDGEILLDPRIDLSVVNFRPISVIGDVQAPGFFDYRPAITVEIAVGLAGGATRAPGNAEARALQRVSLRAEMEGIETALLREAVADARLRTQLAGGDRIDPATLQTVDATGPDRALIAALIAQDDRIIAAEHEHHAAERRLLSQAATEVADQITLMQEQIAAQAEQIKSYTAEIQSSSELADRGLIAAPVRARLLRQVADEETALLRLRTSLAETRRAQTGLSRERIRLDFERAQTWRLALADVAVRTAQLQADLAAVRDRIALVEDWTRRTADADGGVSLTYAVRRRDQDGQVATLDVAQTTPLNPGDVLIVRAELPALAAELMP